MPIASTQHTRLSIYEGDRTGFINDTVLLKIMHMLKHAIIPLFIAISSVAASAHQDTILKLENGVLTGLPKIFQPAKFDVEHKVLTISGKELRFPSSLRRLFPDDDAEEIFGEPQKVEGIPYELTFSASWYHGPSSMLPPYLLIRIAPKERDFRFEVLVDIKDLKFIEARMEVSLSLNRHQSIPIKIDETNMLEAADLDWKSAIGVWTHGIATAKISENAISVKNGEEVVDWLTGNVSILEPGVMTLQLADDSKGKLHFKRHGDFLMLFTERGGLEFVLEGSETGKFYEKLQNMAEQDGAE